MAGGGRENAWGPRFARLITLLSRTFRQTPDEMVFEAYRMGLAGIDLERIESAVASAIAHCRFMPAPAELRDLAGETAPRDRAEVAWETLLRVIRRIGGYQTVDFEDRALNATVRGLGGWPRVTALPSEELHTYVRHAFLTSYAAWSGRAGGEAGEPTPGILALSAAGRSEVFRIPCPYLPDAERPLLSEARARTLPAGEDANDSEED